MESLQNVGRKKWVFKVTAPQNEGNKGTETQNCGLDWRCVLGDYKQQCKIYMLLFCNRS